MNNPRHLIAFAKETVLRNDALKFPASPDVRSLKDQYVELRVTNSEGRSIPVTDLLSQGSRLILVGDPGAGKTTALKYFAIRRSEDFIFGKSNVLPIYFALRHHSFKDEITIPSLTGLKPDQLRGTPTLVLLDGLDELPSDVRVAAIRSIVDLSNSYPESQIILASRPAGLSPAPPDNFRYYHLESLDTLQTRQMLSIRAENSFQLERFEALLSSENFLEGLSNNPLLIQLLWEVYCNQARLPSVRADLYQMVCDFLLSSWDFSRNISGRHSLLDVYSVHKILESIAFDAFNESQHQIPLSDIRNVVVSHFHSKGLPLDNVEPVIGQLLSSGILTRVDASTVSFVHLTFMEFYAARRLVQFPRKLASLLQFGPIAKETILFAAGMILDVAPIIECAVDRRELILAANCLREGRTENRVLETYVLDELQRELGPELIKKLTGSAMEKNRPQTESIHSILRRQLDDVRSSELSSQEKGKRFEQFAERFFRQTFNVVDINRNTENGEIDLILENTSRDPFWVECGGDVFVECKNWDTSRPLKETAAFSYKVRNSRGKLGFFVSVSGFTEDAIRTLKNQVADRDAPLIVPISGESIERMLDHREKFDLFFKEAIRKIKHLHKW